MTQAAPFLLTFDVESWYHANYAEVQTELHSSARLNDTSSARGVYRWIELLAHQQRTSTCFVLGDFAAANPNLIRELANAGHEIATHLWSHDLAHTLGQVGFRESLARSKGTLEDLSGRAVYGLRCPSWSYNRDLMPWFEDEVLKQGIRYDSSIFPFKTFLFGDDRPVEFKSGLIEVLPSVADLRVAMWPYLSGFFMRVTPKWMIHSLIKRAARRGEGAMIVLHPREMDPSHPRLKLRPDHHLIHYWALHSVEPKLTSLLSEYAWTSIDRSLKLR